MLPFLTLIILLWFFSEIILRKHTLKYVGVCNLVLRSSGKKGEKESTNDKENWTNLQIQEAETNLHRINPKKSVQLRHKITLLKIKDKEKVWIQRQISPSKAMEFRRR